MTGGTIAALGLSQLELDRQALSYAKVLAQPTRRKLALLVGINQYTGMTKGEWFPLQGAVNDVELQRELLTLRFGFNPNDILTLTDQKATRSNILQAFEQHLITSAKPGDIVVFHFSGHGSNVIDLDKVHPDGLNGTIVPYDHELPFGYPNIGGAVNDISAGTIFLLMAALKKKDITNVTIILDSCYSGAGVRGNLIVRSRPGEFELRGTTRSSKLTLNHREQDYQRQWLEKLDLSSTDWIQQRKSAIANGVAILAARRDQQALDAVFAQDIHAGVFTHALTRHLWQQTQPQTLNIVMSATQFKTDKFLKTLPNSRSQTPYAEVALGTNNDQKNIYFSSFEKMGSADAVIKTMTGNQAEVLLTVDPNNVEALGRGAKLRLIDSEGTERGIFTIESRNQLEAVGILTLKENAKVIPGSILQEQIRAIPKSVTLRIGLDRSLDPDLDTAKILLNKMPRIEASTLLQQEVHYILGRNNGKVGLFTPSFDPLTESAGKPREPIATEILRLQPKFNMLLATRILKLMMNTTAANFKINAAVQAFNSTEILAQPVTILGGNPIQPIQSSSNKKSVVIPQLKIGQKFQIHLKSEDTEQLFIGIVFFSPDGSIDAYQEEAILSAGQEVLIPKQDGFELQPPLGMLEILIIASTRSVEQTLNTLAQLNSQPEAQRGPATISAIENLLDDLDSGTRSPNQPKSDIRLVDTQQISALSIGFEIVG